MAEAADPAAARKFELLFKLARLRRGKPLSRDQLIEEIWGFDFEGDERTLDVHINRLRERFPRTSTPLK